MEIVVAIRKPPMTVPSVGKHHFRKPPMKETVFMPHTLKKNVNVIYGEKGKSLRLA
jgi:hypothetical protein